MTMAEPTLSELIMVNVCNWYDLGLRLGIDEQSLDEIESSCHGDIRTSKRKMFQAWLKSTPSPSYEKLAQALMEIKECTEANKLCGKYGEDFVTSHALAPSSI